MSISAAGQIGGEHCVSRAQAGKVNAALQAAVSHGMTVVAASGDIGAAAYQCDLFSALTGTPPAFPSERRPPAGLRSAGTQRRRHEPDRQPWHRNLDQRNRLGPGIGKPRQPGRLLPGLRRRVQPAVHPARVPGQCPWHRRHPGGTGRIRRCQRPHRRSGRPPQRNPEHGREPRRDQRQRPDLGSADRAGRPVCGPPPGLRQPGHLPDRPQSPLPPGLPRHHHWKQHRAIPVRHDHRLPRRTRLGPGHRLGQPRRPGPHPAARSLRQIGLRKGGLKPRKIFKLNLFRKICAGS